MAEAASSSPSVDSNGEGIKTVYIAEDQPDLGEMLVLILQAEGGIETRLFNNGLDVFREVRRSPPDLLVLDILLPQLNGLAVARLLKFHDDYRHVPILVMSSVIDPDINERVHRAGADAFLPKPFDVHRLLDKVHQLLARNGAADPPAHP